ncbi:hypothetical protein Tco_0117983 [Tanacetum coccineum]
MVVDEEVGATTCTIGAGKGSKKRQLIEITVALRMWSMNKVKEVTKTTKTYEGRTITVEDNKYKGENLSRSMVGEVKARCFLSRLLIFYEEQGLGKIKVKILGGLEVMLVMENENMAINVIKDNEHGLRR